MGSSKTANALITKFNYEERGMKVWLIKPALDVRDGADVVRSRIGLEAQAYAVTPDIDIFEAFKNAGDFHVVIADECQFFTARQIDGLRRIVDELDIPVLCFGLRTDFLTHTFEGSHRLFEVADSISEIKTVCECGSRLSSTRESTETARSLPRAVRYSSVVTIPISLCATSAGKRLLRSKTKANKNILLL